MTFFFDSLQTIPFLKGVHCKRKEFAPIWELPPLKVYPFPLKSFLLDMTLFCLYPVFLSVLLWFKYNLDVQAELGFHCSNKGHSILLV